MQIVKLAFTRLFTVTNIELLAHALWVLYEHDFGHELHFGQLKI